MIVSGLFLVFVIFLFLFVVPFVSLKRRQKKFHQLADEYGLEFIHLNNQTPNVLEWKIIHKLTGTIKNHKIQINDEVLVSYVPMWIAVSMNDPINSFKRTMFRCDETETILNGWLGFASINSIKKRLESV